MVFEKQAEVDFKTQPSPKLERYIPSPNRLKKQSLHAMGESESQSQELLNGQTLPHQYLARIHEDNAINQIDVHALMQQLNQLNINTAHKHTQLLNQMLDAQQQNIISNFKIHVHYLAFANF